MCIYLVRYFNKYLLILLSLCSIVLNQYGFIVNNQIFTNYLNPFNFIFYFLMGRIAREYNWNFLFYKSRIISGILGLLICFTVWIFWETDYPSYFSLWCVFFVLGSFMVIDSNLVLIPCHFFAPIGKLSFVIYLLHIQFAGIVNTRMSGILEYMKVPIAFFIVILFVKGLLWVLEHIVKNTKINNNLGFR